MLVSACLAGDTTAFGVLVERYTGPLFNVAYRITHNRDDAIDATQSAFAKAYEKLDTFDFSHRFFSWIYRITVNEALDLAKGHRREQPWEGEEPPAADDPESSFAEEEQSRIVQLALRDLGPDARAVIVLRHLRGLSYAEIGEILGIPEKTVKSRLFSARQRLLSVMVERGFVR